MHSLLGDNPSQSTPAGYAWSLKGYRPDTSEFLSMLRQIGQPAFTQHNPLDSELRWIALYCTDEDVSLQDLMLALQMRREALHAMFAHHCVDYRARNFAEGGAR